MRLSWILGIALLSLQFRVSAQYTNTFTNALTNTNVVRTLTLDECIQMALEHNLDIQIERYNPAIAQFTLNASYGYYDPVFNAQATRNNNTREGGGFNEFTLAPFPPTETRSDILAAGLDGVLPTGTRYRLGGDLRNDIATSFRAASNTFSRLISDTYQANAEITVTQPLLRDFWIDAGRTSIKVNRRNLRISEHELTLRIMQVVRNVETAYYDLIFVRDSVKVQEKGLEVAARLFSETARRVQVGTEAPLAEKLAKAQVALFEATLLSAQIGRQGNTTAENQLKALFTDNFYEWQNIRIEPSDRLLPIPATYDIADSLDRALRSRPDYAQFKLEVEKADIDLKYRFNQLFPALDVEGTYGRNGLGLNSGEAIDDIGRGDFPRDQVGIILRFPLSSQRERNEHKQSKVRKRQAILRLKQIEEQIFFEIDGLMKVSQAAFEQIGAARQSAEAFQSAMEAEQRRVDVGRSTSYEVLQIQRDVTNERFRELQALVDYYKTLAQLAFSEASILERHKLTIEIR